MYIITLCWLITHYLYIICANLVPYIQALTRPSIEIYLTQMLACCCQQTEDIEDMEQALEILTVEYPRLAAMLEELITALGLEVLIYIY